MVSLEEMGGRECRNCKLFAGVKKRFDDAVEHVVGFALN